MSCSCAHYETLVDITNNHTEFVNNFDFIEYGDWVKLMRCQSCGQLWKVDEWDKYQALYAQKISELETWKAVDSATLVKERMIKNRGGLDANRCLWKECSLKAVKGNAYCVNHLYETGTRS